MSVIWSGSGKLYEVTDKMTFLGVNCYNVYWFYDFDAGPTFTLAQLATAFVGDYIDPQLPFQNLNLVHHEVAIRAMTVTGLDSLFSFSLAGKDGALDVEGTASFVAFKIALNVEDNATRPGRKALTGFSETQGSNNDWAPSVITTVQGFADVMAADFEVVTDQFISPVVVRRTHTVDEKSVPLPRNQWVINRIISAAAEPKKRPQASRKP